MNGGADFAVRARRLSKIYRIYHRALGPLFDLVDGGKRYTERVALDGIDLELRRGEVVGILGRNGAGKSTLLKLIAGTLACTAGEIAVNGRITAILELGTGFHPEYSGRENIVMGGLCLGMSRSEIEAKLDSVIDFSELGEVIDQPFKTYSTGMQSRLTFATAISVDPDILIVDEALSVGDARFQMKCFSWIKGLRDKRATVLLVSHDGDTITTFCDRALILEQGRLYAEGNPKAMTLLYHKLLFGQSTPGGPDLPGTPDEALYQSNAPDHSDAPAATPPAGDKESSVPGHSDNLLRYGSGEAELLDWGLYDEHGHKVAVVETGATCRLALTLLCHTDITDLSAGFALKNSRGTCVWGITNLTHFGRTAQVSRGDVVRIATPCTICLAAGDYFVTLGAAHLADGEKIDFIEDAISFRVTGPGNIFANSLVNLNGSMTIDTDPAASLQLAEAAPGRSV
jgi:ABC-type polysaccharide/polyol phosphate transport system ATPase subunit